MIRQIHVHDCFKGTVAQILDTLSLGVQIAVTKKSLFEELHHSKPDILVLVTPSYWPAFEHLIFKLDKQFPTLPRLYIATHPWVYTWLETEDLFLPDRKLVLPLDHLNGARFMYTVIDAIETQPPRKTC